MKTTPLEDLYVHTLHCFQDAEETVRNGSSTELDDMIYQALGISVLALYHCLEYENSFAIDSEISTLWATKHTTNINGIYSRLDADQFGTIRFVSGYSFGYGKFTRRIGYPGICL